MTLPLSRLVATRVGGASSHRVPARHCAAMRASPAQ